MVKENVKNTSPIYNLTIFALLRQNKSPDLFHIFKGIVHSVTKIVIYSSNLKPFLQYNNSQ